MDGRTDADEELAGGREDMEAQGGAQRPARRSCVRSRETRKAETGIGRDQRTRMATTARKSGRLDVVKIRCMKIAARLRIGTKIYGPATKNRF